GGGRGARGGGGGGGGEGVRKADDLDTTMYETPPANCHGGKCKCPSIRFKQWTRAAFPPLPLGDEAAPSIPTQERNTPSAPPCRTPKSTPSSRTPRTSSRVPASASRLRRCPRRRTRSSSS